MPHNQPTSHLAPELLHILQHALGLDRYGRGEPSRNHFVTGPGSYDFDRCQQLAAQGYLEDLGPQRIAGGDHCFTVTPAGIDTVALQSPPPPKLTRSQERYRRYLAAGCSFSFREWLGIRERTG